eukprot:TRINITY_DN51816_c0_g1_i1.p1 TRINITY_DN51816_c0_g1~~TRINITY_DN51816_c0_g1_i1.p1  ORF type:complete len:101 (-),score=7.45 TRINITY_DN51816_c0_g1_i1:484-786(-)
MLRQPPGAPTRQHLCPLSVVVFLSLFFKACRCVASGHIVPEVEAVSFRLVFFLFSFRPFPLVHLETTPCQEKAMLRNRFVESNAQTEHAAHPPTFPRNKS